MKSTELTAEESTNEFDGNGFAPLIRLTGVTKVFLTDEVETHALSGIHLDIREGEYISIAGPSGCGKTTLLSILGLLDTSSDGSYALKGHEVANLSFAERARVRNREIGFIFQSFNLIGDLTVFENVELPLTYRGTSASDRKALVTEALERVGMAHRAKHLPSQLSGGQQQRVAVARALAGRPAILLADEPTGNLDSHNGEAVMHLLRELHQGGATICMVTHDERFAQHADRTVHLFDGRDRRGPHGCIGSFKPGFSTYAEGNQSRVTRDGENAGIHCHRGDHGCPRDWRDDGGAEPGQWLVGSAVAISRAAADRPAPPAFQIAKSRPDSGVAAGI